MKQKKWISGGLVLLGIALAIAASQLPPNWLTPDALVNLSSVLTLISFTVRGILALRLLAIGAQLTFIPYCLLQSPPLWTPAIWNVLFLMVNLVNVILLILEKKPVKFSDDERKLYNLAFRSLSPREFLKLLAAGEWRDGIAGDTLIVPDRPCQEISILCHGEAIAYLDGEELAKIPDGKLLGLSTLLLGEPISFEIKLSQPSRYIAWPVEQLARFYEQHPAIREKLQSITIRELAQEVKGLADIAQIELTGSSQAIQSVRERIKQSSQTSEPSDPS
ncbi:MAG: hypothetical protein AB4050_12610 [Synechococcus sp.]